MIRTSDDQILIVDLEFAKRICHNEPLSPLGSLDYLAPEAHNPELLQNDMLLDRMDSFSFGEILFTMLTGTLPFPGFDSAEVGIRAFAFGEDLKPLGKWVKDAALLALIQDLLIRRPEERMSVQQATECLKKIQEERTASHSSSSSSSSSSGSNSGSSSSSDAAASSSG